MSLDATLRLLTKASGLTAADLAAAIPRAGVSTVKAWLAENPRFKVHFTPTHASWMNLVEVWFGIVERQAIRRGIFTSVKDLNAKIRQFIIGWNDRKHPFVWTKTPEQILAKTNPKRTSETRH